MVIWNLIFPVAAELEARVPGLSLGKKYQFRVVACTKVDYGDKYDDNGDEDVYFCMRLVGKDV